MKSEQSRWGASLEKFKRLQDGLCDFFFLFKSSLFYHVSSCLLICLIDLFFRNVNSKGVEREIVTAAVTCCSCQTGRIRNLIIIFCLSVFVSTAAV